MSPRPPDGEEPRVRLSAFVDRRHAEWLKANAPAGNVSYLLREILDAAMKREGRPERVTMKAGKGSLRDGGDGGAQLDGAVKTFNG